MERLLHSGQLDPRPVITHVFPLKDYRRAFQTMTSPDRRCGKVVLEVGG
jgi:threonine 3-dehydrogenase